MKWDGPYKIKCPKCGGRNIWVREITEGISEHFVKNGNWDHTYDSNEYGLMVRTEFECDDCKHKWIRRFMNIESYVKEEK